MPVSMGGGQQEDTPAEAEAQESNHESDTEDLEPAADRAAGGDQVVQPVDGAPPVDFIMLD
jgi:hypothetical protein